MFWTGNHEHISVIRIHYEHLFVFSYIDLNVELVHPEFNPGKKKAEQLH